MRWGRHQTTDISRTFLATFRLQYEDEFSVLSTRFKFERRKFSKCACLELKTGTRNRPPSEGRYLLRQELHIVSLHSNACRRSREVAPGSLAHTATPYPSSCSTKQQRVDLAVSRCCLVKTPGRQSFLGVNFLLNRNKTVTRQGVKSVTLRYLVNKMNTLAGCEA